MENFEPTLTLRVYFQASKKPIAALLAVSIILVFGLWQMSPATITSSEQFWIASIFTGIIVLANLLVGLLLFLRPFVGVLQLSQDALYISVPNLIIKVSNAPRQLRWDQIHHLEIKRFRGKQHIAIGLHPKNSSIDLWHRFCSSTVADVVIPDIFAPAPEDLLSLLNNYRDAYLQRQPPPGRFQPAEAPN